MDQSPDPLQGAEPTPISQLHPDLSNPDSRVVRGEITITWPFSVVTRSIAFKLVESNVVLRRNKGQVRIEFHGPAGRAISNANIGGGDEIELSLQGVELEAHPPGTTSRVDTVDLQLKFTRRAYLKVTRAESHEEEIINVDATGEEDEEPAIEIPSPTATPSSYSLATRDLDIVFPPHSPPSTLFGKRRGSDEFASPAFVKKARLSYGALFEGDQDPFDDGRPSRKRPRFSMPSTWRYSSRSRSNSPNLETQQVSDTETDAEKVQEDAEVVPKPIPHPPTGAQMVDEASQTQNLDESHGMLAERLPTPISALGSEQQPTAPVLLDVPNTFEEVSMQQILASSPVQGHDIEPEEQAFHHDAVSREAVADVSASAPVPGTVQPAFISPEPTPLFSHDPNRNIAVDEVRAHIEPQPTPISSSQFSAIVEPPLVDSEVDFLPRGHELHGPSPSLGSDPLGYDLPGNQHSYPPPPRDLPHAFTPFAPLESVDPVWRSAIPSSTTYSQPRIQNSLDNPVEILDSSSPVRGRSPEIEGSHRDFRDHEQASIYQDEDRSGRDIRYSGDGRPAIPVEKEESDAEGEFVDGGEVPGEDYDLRNYDDAQDDDDEGESEDDIVVDGDGTEAQMIDPEYLSDGSDEGEDEAADHLQGGVEEESRQEDSDAEDLDTEDFDEEYPDEEELDEEEARQHLAAESGDDYSQEEELEVEEAVGDEDDQNEEEEEQVDLVEWEGSASSPPPQTVTHIKYEEDAEASDDEDEEAREYYSEESGSVEYDYGEEGEYESDESDEEDDEMGFDDGTQRARLAKPAAPAETAVISLLSDSEDDEDETPTSAVSHPQPPASHFAKPSADDTQKPPFGSTKDEPLGREEEDNPSDVASQNASEQDPTEEPVDAEGSIPISEQRESEAPGSLTNGIPVDAGLSEPITQTLPEETGQQQQQGSQSHETPEPQPSDEQDRNQASFGSRDGEPEHQTFDDAPGTATKSPVIASGEEMPEVVNVVDEAQTPHVDGPVQLPDTDSLPDDRLDQQDAVMEDVAGEDAVKTDEPDEPLDTPHQADVTEPESQQDLQPAENTDADMEDVTEHQEAMQEPSRPAETLEPAPALSRSNDAQKENIAISTPPHTQPPLSEPTGKSQAASSALEEKPTGDADVERPPTPEETQRREHAKAPDATEAGLHEDDDDYSFAASQQILGESQAYEVIAPDAASSPPTESLQEDASAVRETARTREKPTKPKPERDVLITVQSLRSWDHRKSTSPEVSNDQPSDPSIALAQAPQQSPKMTRPTQEDDTALTVEVMAEANEEVDPSIQLARAPHTPTKKAVHDATSETTPQSRQSRRRSKTPASTAEELRTPSVAGSVSENENLASVKKKLAQDLRTKLAGYVSLKTLRSSVNETTDVFAVATATPPQATRPKNGPRDYILDLILTDQSSAPTTVHVATIIRPFKDHLPAVHAGDVVLLRQCQVVALAGRGFGLKSGDGSSWAVFEQATEVSLPQIKGPPVEISEDETEFAAGLRRWWDLLDERAKGKIEKATQKMVQAGKDNAKN